MSAPILIKHSARSTTSGSRAEFSSVVVPSAKQAAIIKFSVPVTVTMSIKIRAPLSLVTLAWMSPPSMVMVAPIASKPLMCKSTGRAPIAQPPGNDTRARPKRVSKGPKARIEARMVFTSS